MKNLLITGALAVALSACGNKTPTPDAGIDDSCGIDCAAQTQFGLIANSCLEYLDTTDTVTTLGAQVGPVTPLEGGIKVMPVTYKTGGLTKMEDDFTIKNGDLYLVRRSWDPGQSVSYKDSSGALTGVLFLGKDTGPNQNFSSNASADFINGSSRTQTDTTYAVATANPSSLELQTPEETFTSGLKLLINETPDHGSDSRRVFVSGKGFVLFASPINIAGGTGHEYKLQRSKQLDAGSYDCGI